MTDHFEIIKTDREKVKELTSMLGSVSTDDEKDTKPHFESGDDENSDESSSSARKKINLDIYNSNLIDVIIDQLQTIKIAPPSEKRLLKRQLTKFWHIAAIVTL